MTDHPTIDATFYGAPGDHRDGTVRRIPMIQHEQTWEWMPPVQIETNSYPTGERTGTYTRLMAGPPSDVVVYLWQPDSGETAEHSEAHE